MRALVQRVHEASVSVVADPDHARGDAGRERAEGAPGDREIVGAIGPGLVALVGATHEDDTAAARRLADKIWHLRCFDDEAGVMNLSAADVDGEVLVVSQFTLYGDTSRGRRPSWVRAAPPERAQPLVEEVVARLGQAGARVATGRFGADMDVALVNDGPVTLWLEV